MPLVQQRNFWILPPDISLHMCFSHRKWVIDVVTLHDLSLDSLYMSWHPFCLALSTGHQLRHTPRFWTQLGLHQEDLEKRRSDSGTQVSGQMQGFDSTAAPSYSHGRQESVVEMVLEDSGMAPLGALLRPLSHIQESRSFSKSLRLTSEILNLGSNHPSRKPPNHFCFAYKG